MLIQIYQENQRFKITTRPPLNGESPQAYIMQSPMGKFY